MKQHISTFRMMLVVILLIGLFVVVGVVSSQSPETAGTDAALVPDAPTSLLFSYQGQLLDSNGDPITDPAVDIIFKLYDVAELGTACWSEDHTDLANSAVDVEDGLFNVLLGQDEPIETDCLRGDVYLELVVEDETLSPREMLTSVVHSSETSNLPSGSQLDSLIVGDDMGFRRVGDAIYLEGLDGGRLELRSSQANLSPSHDWPRGGWIWMTSVDQTPGGSVTVHLAKDLELDNAPHFDVVRIQSDDASSKLFEIDEEGIATSWTAMQVDGPGSNSLGSVRMGSPSGQAGITMESTTSNEYRADIRRTDNGLDFAVHESNTIPPVRMSLRNDGSLAMNGHSLTEAGNVYGAGDQQIHMPVNNGSIYLNWHRGNAVYFGGGDSSADVIIHNSGIDMQGRSITNCGALVEANLQTESELAAGKIERFDEGDVLCWGEDQLELCESISDPLIQAVADLEGRPIVIGAELIKVVGPVKRGEFLVASDTPGYAMATENPVFGTVIAQALVDFNGDRGLIKAMIRKM